MCNDQSFTDFEVEYIRSAVCWKGAETIGPQSEAIYVFSQINWSVLFPLFIIKRSDCLRHLLPHQTKGTSSVCVCVCGFACFPRCVYFCSLSMECWLALLGLSTPPPAPPPCVCLDCPLQFSERSHPHGPKMWAKDVPASENVRENDTFPPPPTDLLTGCGPPGSLQRRQEEVRC